MTIPQRKPAAKRKAPPKLVPFDAARILDDDEVVAEYMTAVREYVCGTKRFGMLGFRAEKAKHSQRLQCADVPKQ